MTYKIKSLLYFAALMVSVVLYNVTSKDETRETVVNPDMIEEATTQSADMADTGDALLIEGELLTQ